VTHTDLTTSEAASPTSRRDLDTEAAACRLSRRGLKISTRALERLRSDSTADQPPYTRGRRGAVTYSVADVDAFVRRLCGMPADLDLDRLDPLAGWELIDAERAAQVIRIRARKPASPRTMWRRRALGLAPPWIEFAGRVYYLLREVRTFADEMARCPKEGFGDDPDPWEWAVGAVA
jgi:hypothetical protein